MSNIIDSIQLSGTVYTLSAQTSGTVSTAITSGDTNAVAGGAVYDKFDEVEQVTAQALNVLNESLSGKQDTLSAGTGIDITSNVISVTGSTGGKAIEAGRGISVTTGETADTISFNLPIYSGTGTNSIVEGGYSTASGPFSHAEGISNKATGGAAHSEGGGSEASGDYSHAEGKSTVANNQSEHASGQYNVSNKANTTFGNSGNTLFSVGNGIDANNRHNAFEIRQNGDIYISSGGTDIKLQDHLGGGSSYSAGTGINITNNNVISVTGMVATSAVTSAITSGDVNPVQGGAIYNKFDEVEQVTAAALNNLNDKFDGLRLLRLTQAEYDALSGSTDSNTLYVIVN